MAVSRLAKAEWQGKQAEKPPPQNLQAGITPKKSHNMQQQASPTDTRNQARAAENLRKPPKQTGRNQQHGPERHPTAHHTTEKHAHWHARRPVRKGKKRKELTAQTQQAKITRTSRRTFQPSENQEKYTQARPSKTEDRSRNPPRGVETQALSPSSFPDVLQ